jgi:signal transduction histidine kinase
VETTLRQTRGVAAPAVTGIAAHEALEQLLAAAIAGPDAASFLPVAARLAARLAGAAAAEIWLQDEGPVLAAGYRPPEGGSAAVEARALRRALGGEPAAGGGWLVLPIPGREAPAGALALAGEALPDAERGELAALVIGLFQAGALGERFDAAARDQFLALLGHDLRSPLANVRVGAQLARRNLEAGDLESVGEALAIIEAQSARLLARLEALLDAIAAAGHRLIQLEPLDLAAIARAVVAPHRLAAEERGLGTVFTVEEPPRPLLARGDAGQITQVIEQLVDNAAKYAAGGQVTVTLRPAGANVRLDVVDDGPGIRPEDVERVFAPFGRGRATGDKQGYGLGLYLARNIVTAHGGRLWIGRTSRSGTTMSLLLPAVEADGG